MIDIGSEPISHVSFVWSDHWAPNILRLYLISLVSLGPVLSSGNEVQENRHFAEWGNCSESQFQTKRQKLWRTTRRYYHITHTDHLLQPGEEELHCLCPDSLCNEHVGKKRIHNSFPLLSFTQWSLESGASTLTRRASFSAVSQLFSFFLLLSASSVASQTESSPF